VKNPELKSLLRVGLLVFIALVILAAAEYVLGLALESGNLGYMIFMNVVDAALILYFFMHVRQLWHPEE
jgi:heme/copper-type cytochrome/quinol oxidase subunit 4|tara:strand:+ start:98 stop:304 length:207 start_codon:yes stop_codon:yes gene_type:complete